MKKSDTLRSVIHFVDDCFKSLEMELDSIVAGNDPNIPSEEQIADMVDEFNDSLGAILAKAVVGPYTNCMTDTTYHVMRQAERFHAWEHAHIALRAFLKETPITESNRSFFAADIREVFASETVYPYKDYTLTFDKVMEALIKCGIASPEKFVRWLTDAYCIDIVYDAKSNKYLVHGSVDGKNTIAISFASGDLVPDKLDLRGYGVIYEHIKFWYNEAKNK